jgi:hypothetical protein
MLKIVTATVIGFAMLAVLAGDAEAAGRRRSCSPTYSAAVAPAAPVATAQSNVSGYRTFSYQPATTTSNRTFSRQAGGRSSVRAYENGINKSLGIGY